MAYCFQYKTLLSIWATLFIISVGSAQNYNSEVEAKIQQNINEDNLEVSGNVFNKTTINQSLHFTLSVIKNDENSSNTSKSDQTGRLVLGPGEKKIVSYTQINLEEKDRIIILLLVYDTEDRLMGKDRIIINATDEDRLQEENRVKLESQDEETIDRGHEGEDGVILRGIVIEETKTKSGRDFFKMFYSLYNSYNINGDQIVTISEDFAMANTTKIDIKMDNEIVFQFFVRPDSEFLKSAANESIKRVYSYIQRLKQNRNTIKQF